MWISNYQKWAGKPTNFLLRIHEQVLHRLQMTGHFPVRRNVSGRPTAKAMVNSRTFLILSLSHWGWWRIATLHTIYIYNIYIYIYIYHICIYIYHIYIYHIYIYISYIYSSDGWVIRCAQHGSAATESSCSGRLGLAKSHVLTVGWRVKFISLSLAPKTSVLGRQSLSPPNFLYTPSSIAGWGGSLWITSGKRSESCCRASWVGLSNIPKVGVWKRASNLCNVQAVEPSIWKGNMKEGSPNNTKTISKSLTRVGQFPACSAAHSHCKSDSANFPGVLLVDCLHLTFQFKGRRSSRSPSSMAPSSLESTSMQRRDQACSTHASSELLLWNDATLK